MDDDIVLLQGEVSPVRSPYGFNGYNRFGTPAITGNRISAGEASLLADQSFFFQRRKSGVFSRYGGQKNYTRQQMLDFGGDSKRLVGVSAGLSVRGISQNDYTRLANLDLFRGGSTSDVTNTQFTTTSYRMNQQGEIARTKGDALSLLDEAGLESLAEVVSARNSQIVGNALSPGLAAQSLGLLGG